MKFHTLIFYTCMLWATSYAAEQQQTHPKRELSSFESVGIGAGFGALEAGTSGQLCTALQNAQKFPNSPLAQSVRNLKNANILERVRVTPQVVKNAYQGVGANISGMTSATALQFGFNTLLTRLTHTMNDNKPLTDSQNVAIAVAAGMGSATTIVPGENVQLQAGLTENSKSTSLQVAQKVYNQYGMRGLYRGIVPTAARDGAFTAIYMQGVPMAKRWFQKNGMSEGAAAVAGGLSVGIPTMIGTQPLQVLKMTMQGNPTMNARDALASCKSDGLFTGWKWRTLRGTIFIAGVGNAQDKVIEALTRS